MRVLVRVYCSVRMRVFVGVPVPMLIVRVGMLMRVLVRVRVFVLMILNGVVVIVFVRVLAFYKHVDLGPGESPAHDLPALKPRPDVQGCHRVFQHGEGDSGIHKSAEKHIAGDAGEAFEISNSHQGNCKRDSGIAAGVG